MVQTEHLTKVFSDNKRGDVKAVQDASFEAKAGQIVGRVDPTDAQAVLGLAVARHAAGDKQAALADLEAIAAAAPNWITPHQVLTRLAIAEGRPGDARAIFVRSVR